MKVRVTAMRLEGVSLGKSEMDAAAVYEGVLSIIDRHDDYLHRMIKLAALKTPDGQIVNQLIEPHVVWIRGNQMMLTGFERLQKEERQREYAQSWLCILRPDQSVDGKAMAGVGPSSRNHRYRM